MTTAKRHANRNITVFRHGKRTRRTIRDVLSTELITRMKVLAVEVQASQAGIKR